VKILLTGNICNLPFKQQVAATTAAFAALPFADKIETVYYMSLDRGVAQGHLKNKYQIQECTEYTDIRAIIDAIVYIRAAPLPVALGIEKGFAFTGKPVYLIEADNPGMIRDGWNISSAEVCRIRGWNVGDVVSDGIALRAIDRIEEFAVYGRLCNDNQFEFGDEQQLLLDLRYKKEDL
jgi:hypothetical protein